jgi:apolipoprotein N-acyltransferase
VARDPFLKKRTRIVLLSGYVVATFLSFPHPVGERVIDLGLLCGWLSPAFLLLGLHGLIPRSAAKFAFVAAMLAHTAILHWLYIVSVTYGHMHPALGLLAPLGAGAHAALFTALFAAVLAWLGGRARSGGDEKCRTAVAAPWAVALLWTGCEYLRSIGSLGFPWSVLGYSQHDNSILLAVTAYTGVYGLSFVTALGGACLANIAWALRVNRGVRVISWSAAVGVAVFFAVGALLLSSAPEEGGDRVRIAVLQGNIEQGVKWDPGWVEGTLRIYEGLSRQAAAAGADLIVFPETAVPGALNADFALRDRFSQLARETRASLVVGGIAVEFAADSGHTAFYDSAFLVGPDGQYGDRYDKSRLVPFGEYVPFQAWLGGWIEAVARGMATQRVTPGDAPRALTLPIASRPTRSAAKFSQMTAGVPICYELLFPDLTRRFVGDGAQVLLAITNDAWYGRTGAPYQFLAMTAVRAAENGVWTARAANTGVSAIIDSQGRVRSQTRIFERDLLVADVPLRPAPVRGTFYSRHGDVFVGLCGAGIAGLVLAGPLRRVRGKA